LLIGGDIGDPVPHPSTSPEIGKLSFGSFNGEIDQNFNSPAGASIVAFASGSIGWTATDWPATYKPTALDFRVAGLHLAGSGDPAMDASIDPVTVMRISPGPAAAYNPAPAGTIQFLGKIRGDILPEISANNDLGSTSYRWQNLYTTDLQLSNLGREEGNKVDGTKGDWTLQEGEEDLFVINNISGKKYKIALIPTEEP